MNQQAETQLYLAPLQGYTDAEYRRAHRDVYGANEVMFTPFLRIDKGEICRRTLRDILSPLNAPEGVIPQIIVGGVDEFDRLTGCLKSHGFRHIDINMGCPFPPQVKRGRGAGTLIDIPLLEQLAERVAAEADCAYSVKMRAGVDLHSQWEPAVDILNRVPLRHVCLHPRIAKDQYRGMARREVFADFAARCVHPVVYNGDIATLADISSVADAFPAAGIMVGRGLLARPSLFAEWRQGAEWTASERLNNILLLHERYRELISARMQGDHQLLAKMKPFWEYLENEVGRKAWKTIKKANSIAAYNVAVASVNENKGW